MSYKKLTIPNPCPQKWSKMKPNGEGRHCKSCDTTIVDFSELSDQELISVLQTGKYHCGRFHEDQMEIMFYVEEKRKERKKYWNSIAAAIVAGVLQVSSGFSQTEGQSQKQKLYPRNLAIEKYFESDSEASTTPQPKKKEKEEPKDKVIFIFKNKKYDNLMKNVTITIKELNYSGSSNDNGEIEISLDKNINQNQIITLEIQANIYKTPRGKRGYHGKTMFLELDKLTNDEKVIYIHSIAGNRRPMSRRVMGAMSF